MTLHTRLSLLFCAVLILTLLVLSAAVYLIVARAAMADQAATLRLALIGGALLACLLACLAVWLLVGKALAPSQAEHARLANTLAAQRRITADTVHALRTPLTAVRGSLERLARVPPVAPAAQREAAEAGMGEADRLLRLVDTLFVLARTDSGEQQLASTPVALAPIAGELVRQACLQAPKRSIAVSVPAELFALGDPDAIRQILTSLLDNALAHTPPEAVIGVRGLSAAGRAAVVVADTGPGIAPTQLARIFERFYRSDEAGGHGIGLGLAIATALAEHMGGTLSVTSTLGAGSVFTLSLPLAPTPALLAAG